MTSGLSPVADPGSAQVCVLDYGSGNVQSVRNLVSTITSTVSISNDPHAIESAGHARGRWRNRRDRKSAVEPVGERSPGPGVVLPPLPARSRRDDLTAQAAEILAPLVGAGETLLDAGCGGGYYYWSFQRRGVPVDYFGLDYTPQMIALARSEICPAAGLSEDRFVLGAIEHLDRDFGNVVCFNVLTNSPHYGQPLERLLSCARKRILLRESMGDTLVVRYTPDPYLDEGKRHIRVYHNTYPIAEVMPFMEAHGFSVTRLVDRRTGDGTEMVVDIPHYWRILLGERHAASQAPSEPGT